MKTSIRDKDVLRSVGPLDVAAFLRTSGWVLTDAERRYTLWHHPAQDGDNPFEVLVPATGEVPDFPRRMAELLDTLEIVEARPQVEILEDLLTPNDDIIRIRAAGRESRDGSLPFEDGVELVDHARELLLAAACSTVEPRTWFETKRPSDATEFVRRLRMGQTARGSFVMTIQCRVPPALDGRQGLLDGVPDVDPFERRVTHTLSIGLDAMQRAAVDAAANNRLDAFRNAVPHGLSANLCNAVAGLVGRSEDQTIDVSFSWARVRARPNSPSRIRFAPDAIRIIKEAGRALKEESPRPDFELVGPLTRLARSSPGVVGSVTIGGFVDGRPRQVKVDLTPEDYSRACEAHDMGEIVRCTGVLTKDGRSFVLREPRGFGVVEDV